ncbi:MAG: hypothetical protein IPG90_22080 [Bacteroidetes bacterium]|nr:hypothetical protein [Bacteroidota bacterium]
MNNNSIIASYKVSKRKDLDIATVSSGFRLTFKNDEISEAILAYGGMAEKTKRATSAESFLIGKMDKRNAEKAGEFVYSEYTPLSRCPIRRGVPQTGSKKPCIEILG